MNIEFNDKGAVATVTITSTIFELRKHNRAVDAALFSYPGATCFTSGGIFRKTVISGKTVQMLRAVRLATQEAMR